MNSGIYMIRHRESGQTYIGRSVHVTERWTQHCSAARTKKTNNHIENAIRKHGEDAFEWKLLVSAPARLHALLEAQFIGDWQTWSPNGYNVGGTTGGFVPLALRATMPVEEQERRLNMALAAASKGHAVLREKRKDPEYEANFLAIKSAASLTREARIRKKCAADPEYAARIKAQKAKATVNRAEGYQHKGSAIFKERMANDPDFADKVRENRRRAAFASHAARRQNGRIH
jgi:hypothetical protein